MRSSGDLRSLLLLPVLLLACDKAPTSAAPPPVGGSEPAAAPTAAAEVAAEAPEEEARRDPAEARAAEDADAQSAKMDAPRPSPAPEPAPAPGTADRSQSRLDIAVPSINGGLNRDIIRRIATDHADDIRECHGRALASMPDLVGKLVVEVDLDADGNVTKAKLARESSLQNRDVESCVIALIEGWSFREAGGKGSAALSFEF